MNFSLSRLYQAVFILLLPIFLSAQTTSLSEEYSIVNTEVFSKDYHEADSIEIVGIENQDLGAWTGINQAGIWFLDFHPYSNNPIGRSRATVKVYQSDSTSTYFHYEFISVNFKESFIETYNDYIRYETDTSFMVLDLLGNDYSTEDIFIRDFSLIKNGSVNIDSNGVIQFVPDTDFNGVAVVNYVACDTFSNCDNAEAYIFIVPDTISMHDTIELFTVKNKSTTYLSPLVGIQTSAAASGDVTIMDEIAIIYQPDEDFTGMDTFTVSLDTLFDRTVIVHVFDQGENNLFIQDDNFYGRKNQNLNLDVFANDEPYLDLVSFSNIDTGTISFDSTHQRFYFEPPLDFEGTASFEYTCSNGLETESGRVKILVKNIKPETTLEYHFYGLENVPLLIRYDVPTNGHQLSLVSDPEYGDLEVNETGETFDEGCSPVTVTDELVYYPEDDWTGTDEFTISHCIAGECTEIQIVVEFLPDNGDCHCMSGDCLWPGDANNDGVVDMLDLLTVGYYLGDITIERLDANINWNSVNPDPVFNANEYADTDGNGLVSVFDTSAISQNYYNTHEIVPDVLPLSDYNVNLVPESTVLDSGDLAVLHIELGDLDLPLYDVYGISFSLDFSGDAVDSSSVAVEISANSWFLNFTRALDLTKIPWDGRVDVGFSRTNGISADGYGLVSTVSFIVTDIIEGFRLSDNRIPVHLKLHNIVVKKGDGSMSQLSDVEKTIYVKISTEDNPNPEPTESKLYLYPNPSDGAFNVHLNGQNQINTIRIFTMSGAEIARFDSVNAKRKSIQLNHLPTGIYIVQVETDQGVMAKKMSITR